MTREIELAKKCGVRYFSTPEGTTEMWCYDRDLQAFADALVSAERERSDNDLREENKKLRHLLFMAHGSAEHYLYGDDGERTCNTCGIDFNTDSADEISRKIHEYNMRELARIHPEWLKLGDATVRNEV